MYGTKLVVFHFYCSAIYQKLENLFYCQATKHFKVSYYTGEMVLFYNNDILFNNYVFYVIIKLYIIDKKKYQLINKFLVCCIILV